MPALHPGDICIVVRGVRYEEGDVVLYHHGGDRVLHRVVAAGPRGVRTRGDANRSLDREMVPLADVEGRVVRVFRLSEVLHLASPSGSATLLNQSHTRR